MLNYRNTTIEGNATRDPVFKKTKTGKSLCSFSLAMNHNFKDGADPQVSYFDVETWDKLAEVCAGSIKKGKRVIVFGSLKQERWEDAEGKKHSRYKVVGKDIRFPEPFKKQEAEPERKSA